jgi:hypothetical protein
MIRFFALAVLLLAALTAHAQSEDRSDCMREVTGSDDIKPFQRFDHDFRIALEHRDAAAMAQLAQFPLRVNFADGSNVLLTDPGTLQKQFERVFTPALRVAVRDQVPGDLICKYSDGFGYALGSVWVHPAGADGKQLRIVAVNVPGGALTESKAGAIDLACSTKQFRIIVDATGKTNAWRYRVWNLPHGLSEKPDLELTGTRDFEGTSPCTHRVWQFRNADATYELDEAGGCGPDAPPRNAAAQLVVSIGGETKLQSWCF